MIDQRGEALCFYRYLFPSRVASDSGECRYRHDCYIEASLQIEFDEDGTASFIEVSCHADTLCTYKGHDVFDLPAPDLFAVFAADDGSGQHLYDPSEYLFPELIVSLWKADE